MTEAVTRAVFMIIMSKVTWEITMCVIAGISSMLLTTLVFHLTSSRANKRFARLAETTFGANIGFSFAAFV